MTRQWTRVLLAFGTIAVVTIGGQSVIRGQQAPAKGTPDHVVLTSQQDRQHS